MGWLYAALIGLGLPVAQAQMDGAVAEPIGLIDQNTEQIRLRFPESIKKTFGAFKVECNSGQEGTESWADNNRIWTYTFKPLSEISYSMARGSTCQVKQVNGIEGVSGKKWSNIQYSVSLAGPKVEGIYAAAGFEGTLRDVNPVLLIQFEGAIDRAQFFAGQHGYLAYKSANAPAEKIYLAAVPQDQEEKILAHFQASTGAYGVSAKSKNWVLATVKQNLIPGASVTAQIEGVVSAYDPSLKMTAPVRREFTVRSQFLAKVECTAVAADNATCLPGAPIQVRFNGRVKWSDVRDTFIEYIPFQSKDGKSVRSYPDLPIAAHETYVNQFINLMGRYLPMVARFSTTVVEGLSFNPQIEPETLAKVVLESKLHDIEGRKISNATMEFHLKISSLREVLRLPGPVAVFEKNIQDAFLPVRLANLHQKLTVRKTGSANNAQDWSPIQDPAQIMNLIKNYSERGDYRETPDYRSPLETLGLAHSVNDLQMTGEKNRYTVLQFPFAKTGTTGKSGLYAIEIASPSLEMNNGSSGYVNPRYSLASVTDLALHIKKGSEKSLIWVTRYSTGLPVANATVEVFDCLGTAVSTGATDVNGVIEIASVQNKACETDYSVYGGAASFFAFARTADDLGFTHSSWRAANSSAMEMPDADYFYSEIQEGRPHFHAIIGVNLVKPGQQVPMQIFAKLPTGRGFGVLSAQNLPVKARLTNSYDNEIFYEFPLAWQGDVATLSWQVPGASAVRLGSYELELLDAKGERVNGYSDHQSVEVAEFKIPLMSGNVALPQAALIQPQSLPVNTSIRFANGVGAQDLGLSLTYFFEPTSVHFDKFAGFRFANGAVQDQHLATDKDSGLPRESRPSFIEGLVTGADGSILRDLALEKVADGREVREVLTSEKRPQRFVVRARYQDQSGEYQTLSVAKTIHASEWYVGTKVDRGSQAVARLQAALVRASGEVAQNADDLQVQVLRVNTKLISEQLFGGLIKTTVEKEYNAVRWNGSCVTQQGLMSCKVTPLVPGTYVFQARSKSGLAGAHTFFKVDRQGNVHGEHDYFYFGDEVDQKTLPLALNKKTYKGGEKALVSFPAPFKTCSALVTVERANVISSFVQAGACEKGAVQVPLDSEMAPNAFISVYAVSGRMNSESAQPGDMDLGRPTYRIGFANAKIDWDAFSAKVDVKTNKPVYEPKETVEVTVQAKADLGQLIDPRATIIVLEEKILELKENKTYDLLSALMQMRDHRVLTITSLRNIQTVTAGNPERDAASRKGGDEGGDGGSAEQMKRQMFDALVHFSSVPLVNGEAKVSFKANDSLTNFRVIAVVTSGNQKFGSGAAKYLSSQETQTFAGTPAAVHTGDQFPLVVNLQNNSSADQVYTVEVEVEILDEEGNVIGRQRYTKSVQVRQAASGKVDVADLTVGENASRLRYKIRVKDAAGKLVDSLEPEPTIVSATVPLSTQDAFLEQMTSSIYQRQLTKDQAALPGQGRIEVRLGKSLVDGVKARITQQITNDPFAGFFIESKVFAALLSGSKTQMTTAWSEVLPLLDQNGFVKYHSRATRGSVWLTAAIVNAFHSESWALQLMPSALRARLKNAVGLVLTKSVPKEYYTSNAENLLRAQILMGVSAYVLNEADLISAAQAVYAEIQHALKMADGSIREPVSKWSNSNLVDYWMFELQVDPRAASASEAFKLLTGPRLVYTGNTAQLTGRPLFNGLFYSDETIETAKLLSGVALLAQDKNLARVLAAGLINANRKAWYVSATLAWVGGSLSKFSRAFEAVKVDGVSSIQVPTAQKQVDVDWSQAQTGELISPWAGPQADVSVRHQGAGKPWVSVQAKQAVVLTQPRVQGLEIAKSLKNLTRTSGFKAGDLVEVTLRIQSLAVMSHVAMMDPIPGGSNIVAQPYGDFSDAEKSYRGYKIYFEYLPKGETEVRYQYQLNNKGVYKMAPSRIEGIYEPSVFGETPNNTLTVE